MTRPHGVTAWPSIIGAALAALVALAPSARADDLARAKKLFKQGEIHFDLRDFRKALSFYREAYKAKPLPAFLFNIAQCHYNVGDHKQAIAFYQRYLLKTPNARNRTLVESLIRKSEEALKKQGSAPTSAPTSKPTSTSQPTSRPTNVAKGSSGQGSSGSAGNAGAAGSGGRGGTDHGGGGPRTVHKVLLWGGVALGAALLVTGAVTGGIAMSKSSEFKEADTPLARQLDLRDSGQTLGKISTTTLIAGAAIGAATALYYWLGYPSAATPRVGVAPYSRGGLVALSGTF